MKATQKTKSTAYYRQGRVLSTLQLAPRPCRFYSDSGWIKWLNQLPKGKVFVMQANLTEIKKVKELLWSKTHYWNIYGEHYLTFAGGGFLYYGAWGNYSLRESINEIEETTGLRIIKENEQHYIEGFSRPLFETKKKSGEIKALYKSCSYTDGHDCYNYEDMKKCILFCKVCGCVINSTYRYILTLCNKCSDKERERSFREWQNQERSQKQFRECRKLLRKSRRALQKGDLNACKLLSKEFKQVAILR